MTSYAAILVTFPDVVIKKQLKGEKIVSSCLTDEGTIDGKVQGDELEADGPLYPLSVLDSKGRLLHLHSFSPLKPPRIPGNGSIL